MAAAVTDLLQSVQLEYHGYEGDVKEGSTDSTKGATQQDVTNHLNGLFSLVQGLGGTAVVRTYIDQLAQVLSALVGWSKIKECSNGNDKCNGNGKKEHGKNGTCEYLKDVEPSNNCEKCECMKWNVAKPDEEGTPLGRKCTKCEKGNCGQATSGGCQCKCKDGTACTRTGTAGQECQCDRRCCCTIDTYRSAYRGRFSFESRIEGTGMAYREVMWKDLTVTGHTTDGTTTEKRSKCARILLGSVCLIWSGLTYMYWTGKYYKGSPRWNNHILDGSGLDDGTLSQWLQALGFPREMLNDHGPRNRLDAVIWNGLKEKLFWGFTHPSGSGASDHNDNTARQPAGMNYPGFVHTIHRDSFHQGATVFRNGTGSSTTDQVSDTYRHKRGALFKLYILSCAYFTGLQKNVPPKAENRTPKTIREILYWLSALPYSQAYKEMLGYAKEKLKEVLKKPGDTGNDTPTLAFLQQGRNAPITVHEFNLFAHFQAVTQYCPLVLIGIQGGIHSTKGTESTKEPAIHALYANTECSFTYPAVDIQAYNQVVHYIRALFYQLYFLRKQCAVKVTCGGKWRECRYGSGVVSKGVVTWMCLGCNPMEHDRKCRVKKVKGELKTVPQGGTKDLPGALKELLEKIGGVVVQLGNAQEALEGRKKEAIEGVKKALTAAKDGLGVAQKGLDDAVQKVKTGGLDDKLKELTNGGRGKLKDVENALGTATGGEDFDQGKNKISDAINKVHEVLKLCKEWAEKEGKSQLNSHQGALLKAIEDILVILGSTRCVHCKDHAKKCGKQPVPSICEKCHQQYMDGTPSPLQAFLEDRLPGFSCKEVVDQDENPDYPPAASHLEHCGGSGQCCPLPMGFRNNFCKGGISDCTGARLYGILYFFSNGDMMQSCVYTLVRVTAALSATTPQVLGDVFGFFRGGIGEKESGETKNGEVKPCEHQGDPSNKGDSDYFCGWCASGLRDEVKKIEWIPRDDKDKGGKYMKTVGQALIEIKGEKGSGITTYSSTATANTSLSRLTKNCQYLSPLTGELYTAVSATFGGTYLSWVLYLSDALEGGLQSLSDAFQQIECRGCKGNCDPNKCKKGSHGTNGESQCKCQSIVSCTGVLPVLYRHGFSYGNPFNLEGFKQENKEKGQYDITKDEKTVKHCHDFLESLKKVIESTEKDKQEQHPLTNLLTQVGQLQYDIRLPWIFVLTLAWLLAVMYLAFGAIWPLDWTHMRTNSLSPVTCHYHGTTWAMAETVTGEDDVEKVEEKESPTGCEG